MSTLRIGTRGSQLALCQYLYFDVFVGEFNSLNHFRFLYLFTFAFNHTNVVFRTGYNEF